MSEKKYITLDSETIEALQQELSSLRQRLVELEKTIVPESIQRDQIQDLALEEKRERVLAKVIQKIRQSLDIETIFKTTTQELRNLLNCDRVAVYRFNNAENGEFVFDSIAEGWNSLVGTTINPIILQKPYLSGIQERKTEDREQGEKEGTVSDSSLQLSDQFISPNTEESFVINDVYKLIESLQFRSYCVVPVFVGEKRWGLLGAYQNSEPRQWEQREINLLAEIGNQLGLALQHAEAITQLRVQSEQLAKAVEREKAVATVIDKIRRSLDLNTIFQTTVQEVRDLIQADRVAIYRFNHDWSGEFVVESTAQGWVSLLQNQTERSELRANISDCGIKLLATPKFVDTYLQETAGGPYTRGETFRVVEDIDSMGFSDCYLTVMKSLQAKAYATIGIYQGEQLWGLLTAYQNTRPRHWEQAEINFLIQISGQLSVALQQAELFRQAQQQSTELQTTLEAQLRQRAHELAEEADRERAIAKVIEKIRQTLDIETIFQTTATEVRQLLNADRVAMFRFTPGASYSEGEFVSEDVLSTYASAIAAKVRDHCFGENHAQYYKQGRIWAANDVYEVQLQACHLAILGRFQVRANLVVPLLKGDELWGLLCIHQCSGPRQWQEKDIEFVTHIAVQLGVALQQAELLAQAQKQSEELQALLAQVQAQKEQQAKIAEQERAFSRSIERIHHSLDIDTIFRITTQEVRQILKCDRVVFYQFKPDWTGEFVFESVTPGWMPFVEKKQKTVWNDTYLQESQGGRYRNHENTAVNNIYRAGLSECYIKILEQFQIKAYISVPIFVGQKLWGLLAAYQHSEPRNWEPIDVSLVAQLGNQLGVALQQAELLAQLKKAKETADAANRAKSDFLAHMSHELRTPLNAILGFTQLMSRDKSLKPDQQENLSIINRSGEHLLTLINDVLEMSKIEAGQTTLNESSFDLYFMLDSLQEMLDLKAQEKSLQLIFDRAANVPQYVCTDESKLRQVLINLLGNGIKFTHDGCVILRVMVDGNNSKFSPIYNDQAPIYNDQLLFEIEDTGPGIAPEEIDTLFEPFAQAEIGRKSQEGTGLGLPISRKFVQLMGGDLTVTSTLGVGTIFKFNILVKPANAIETQPPKTEQQIISLEAGQPTYRILVVEDKWANRQLLVQLLVSIGFEVKEATNGQEAIALSETWAPHLIWMDMRMPVMDGYAATQEIKARSGDKAPIIIALTANAFEEERLLALSIGCDDFVRKPFQENAILERIAEHLGVRYIYAARGNESTLGEGQSLTVIDHKIDSSPMTHDPSRITNLRILLADDNAFNQKLAVQMLKQLDYEADVVSSGTEVLEALQRQVYDVVLMDVKMPGIDGLETTRRICRKWTASSRPRIIAMTASTTQSDRDHCLAAGMDDFISKPIRLEELSQALSQCQTVEPENSKLQQEHSDTDPILDANALENIRQASVKDGNTLLKEMIEGYLSYTPKLMRNIREAISRQEPAKLDLAAHTLKSMSATFGANTFTQLCKELELMGSSGAIAVSSEQLAQLETEYQRLITALELERQKFQ